MIVDNVYMGLTLLVITSYVCGPYVQLGCSSPDADSDMTSSMRTNSDVLTEGSFAPLGNKV